MNYLYLLLTACVFDFDAAAFSAKEKNALQELRPLVEDELYLPYMKLDAFLLRWLEDKNYNVHDAKEKLLKAIRWRKDNKIDGILAEPLSFVDELLPYQIKTKDLLGNPVVTTDYNSWDVRRVALAGHLPLASRYLTKLMETCVNKSTETEQYNSEVNKWILFGNLQGFNLKRHGCLACIPLNLECLTTYENYYTGSMRYLIFVNAPRSFDTLAGLARNIMSPGTRKAFKIYTGNKEEWDFLDTIIARSELPPRHGGTNKIF